MTIRWGIIGCGDVTEVKSGPGLQNAEGSALVAVMRRNGEKAADYARRHQVPRWYDDADRLINDPEVDAVYVATPPGSHLEYALAICTAGKAAYVEKPMARNHAECVQMVEAFRAAGLPLFVAYYRRGLPRFRKVKELVESGRIGKITSVSYRFASDHYRNIKADNLPWRLVAEEAGGGLFLDLGCHTLDILDFILGPLQDAEGTAANLASPFAVEDSVALRFRTESGGLGTAAWNFAAGVREDIIELTGTEGRIALSTFGNEPIQMRTGNGDEKFALLFPASARPPQEGTLLRTEAGDETFDLPNPKHIQQPFIQLMTDSLHGKGECPSTGETAARTSQVIDIALGGYYGGRGDAFWTRPETWPGRRV